MNKKNIIIIGAVTLVVIIVAALFFLKSSPKDGLKLETATIKVGKLSTSVTATGTIEPITSVTVGTQVSGKVAKIYVDYNSVVKKGQVLAEIDRTTLETEYKTQELGVKSAKVQYDYQKKNYERQRQLHDQKLISETDYETAKYNYETAESAYQQNISNLQKAKTNLDYATIYSPIDGVVLSRAVEEGQTVAASFSTPTLFTIARDLTKMQVVANVDEADIGNVSNGQRVTFTVDAYPNDVFDGTVTQVRLNPTTTSNVVTYQVIVNAPNPKLKLKPGLTANITIYTMEKENVKTLANKALNFKPDTFSLAKAGYTIEDKAGRTDETKKAVWVKKGKNLEKINITVGETDGINTEIISGLTPDEEVVTEMSEMTKADSKTLGSTESSPFMPKRPGANNQKKTTAK